jgi:signal transduction histidine kinase
MKLTNKAILLALMLSCSSTIAWAFSIFDQAFGSQLRLIPVSEMEFSVIPNSAKLEKSHSFKLELQTSKFERRQSWKFGFTDNIVWTRFTVVNDSNIPLRKILLINHIYLNELRAFTIGQSGDLLPLGYFGLNAPLNQKDTVIGGYGISLDLAPNTAQTVYLRATSKYPLSLPVTVMTPSQYENFISTLTLILTFYSAFILALMLYNVLLYYVTKERTFLYYVLTILGLHFFTNLSQYGVTKELLFPSILMLHKNIFHFAHVASLLPTVLFATAYFGHAISGLHRKVLWTLSLSTIPLSIIGVVSGASLIDLVMQINTTIFCFYLLGLVGYLAFFVKYRPAVYFWFAWAFLICAWVLNFLKIDGAIPSTPANDGLVLFGAAIECLLLSLAIADRIRRLSVEKIEIMNQLDLIKERELIFRQVAHDIRSPLSALNLVSSSLTEVGEDKRLLLRTATQRINDIANNLLQKSKEKSSHIKTVDSNCHPSDQTEPAMICSILDSIISETRAQLGDRSNLEIQTHVEDGYGLFALIDPSEFARVISNLLNNSIEAMPEAGRITVEIRGYQHSIVVSIIDNGRGMPKEVLKRIGEKGFTFGKEGTRSGSGLGLYHARQTVESAKGSIEFDSQLDQGTMVTIKLPRAIAPEWFVEGLQLSRGSTLVSIDDDESIHQIWAKRLSDLKEEYPSIKHLTFTSTCEFEAWLSVNTPSQVQFLVDYEFLGKNENGLDLIESTGIQGNSILVTSRFEEAEVCKRAKALGVRIIPKGFAPCVPIVIS